MCDETVEKAVDQAERGIHSPFYDDSTFFEAVVAVPERSFVQPVMIRYRPPQSLRLAQFFTAQKNKAAGPELLDLHVQFICEHLDRWDLRNAEGQPVEFKDGTKPLTATWRRLDFGMILAISEVIQEAAPSTEALRKNF
ncbi:MAG TPA: hypothetical protein VM487_18575 [Phycisphaerae bacterium]|nr:hypothetical protein [Phycisphaerae bacterium]